MILLLVAWGIYFFLHSLMADEPVKQRLMKTLRLSQQNYRIFYNIFNFIALGFLLRLLFQTPSTPVYTPDLFITAAAVLVCLAGAVIMFLSVKNYDLPAFFGTRKETMMPLQVKGLNQYMRHPLYSGTILLAIGICIAFPYIKNWLLLLLMIMYIFIGIRLEEKKLVQCYGDEYRNYQKKVKQLIPHVR